ncbi:DNA-directed RNA polymerase [Candidatus Woesearchaeota archaeon]|nr:DNA-directed RNA polymerase [Candidatus Woesearchaeota archaeon]
MFYKLKLKDHIRVPPSLFEFPVEEAIISAIKKTYTNMISKNLGIIIDVVKIAKINEGIIIPGDGASYYDTEFELLTFRPELQEVILGGIRDIADFGVFITMGPTDGMIHVSQTMDDYVSFSKDKSLLGKESKKSLKVGDKCRARIIAVSFKEATNPKIGLTMRQIGLGKIDWIREEAEEKNKKSKDKPTKGKGDKTKK